MKAGMNKALSASIETPRTHQHIAFYGTLLRDEGVQQRLGASNKLKPLGGCIIPGYLFDLGAFPGLTPGRLDDYEGAVPDSTGVSLYARRIIRLVEPDLDAWVYHYKGATAGSPKVLCGSWARYLRAGRRQEQSSGPKPADD